MMKQYKLLDWIYFDLHVGSNGHQKSFESASVVDRVKITNKLHVVDTLKKTFFTKNELLSPYSFSLNGL